MSIAVDLTKNKMWVNRMSEFFNSVDLNKNGFLTIDEMLKWAANMQEMCKASDLKMTNLRFQIQQFWGAAGLKPGVKMTKNAFIEGMNRLAQEELERKQGGQRTRHEQLNNAFIDVMDINNDGTVTLDELKIMMKACDMDPSGADSWFNAADYNKNGKVERQELNGCEFDFWFRPESEENSDMFGGAYSGRQSFP